MINFILGYAALQSGLLIYIFATSPNRKHPGFIYLISLLLVSTFIGLQYLLFDIYPQLRTHSFLGIRSAPIFLLPALYTSLIYSLTNSRLQNRSKFLLFFPFIFFQLNEWSNHFFVQDKIKILLILVLFMGLCGLLSFRSLNRAHSTKENQNSVLHVLNYIMLVFSVCVAIYAAGIIILEWKWIDLRVLIIFFLVAFVTVLELHLARNFKTFLGLKTGFEEKYKVSNLQANNIDTLHRDLNHLFKNERIYRDVNLTLSSLSAQLSVNRHQLTEFLNQEMNVTFNELINTQRVSHFKQSIKEGKHAHMSISGLAKDAGFKSTSTFYRVFKKSTGLTPSKFIEESNS